MTMLLHSSHGATQMHSTSKPLTATSPTMPLARRFSKSRTSARISTPKHAASPTVQENVYAAALARKLLAPCSAWTALSAAGAWLGSVCSSPSCADDDVSRGYMLRREKTWAAA